MYGPWSHIDHSNFRSFLEGMHRNPKSYDSISIHFENLMKAERDMIWYLYKLLFEGKVAETKITEGPEF